MSRPGWPPAPAWRERIEVVAIDPSAAFRRALREHLPRAAVSVDAFHLVKLANDVVTQVRQRVVREGKGRRGRLADPAWANRRLLLRAGDALSPRALARLQATFTADDPTQEISAAWGIKERLRILLTATSVAEAEELRMHLGADVLAAAMPETDRPWKTIEVLVITGLTNARNLTHHIARSLLETGGFKPNYTLNCGESHTDVRILSRLGFDAVDVRESTHGRHRETRAAQRFISRQGEVTLQWQPQ